MDMPSVPAIQFLVNSVSLYWHRQRRLPASSLWWLWLLTILIHLWLSVPLLTAAPATSRADTRPVMFTPWPANLSKFSRAEGFYLVGSVGLMLILRPGEASPFPWLRQRVRPVVRRRRLANLSLEELPGLTDRNTHPCPVGGLVDPQPDGQAPGGHPDPVPHPGRTGGGSHHRQILPPPKRKSTSVPSFILCLNRLTAPRPLSGIADWAAKTVIEELTGVPACKLNDDRLARALDAIYPHLKEIWTEIVSVALVRYRIDLSLVFYDLTAFYFEGECRHSARITFGYSRQRKGKKQGKLALNVTAREKVSLLVRTAGQQCGGCEHRADQHAAAVASAPGPGLAGG